MIFIRIFSNKDNDFVRLKKSGFLIAPNEIHYPGHNKGVHYFEKKEIEDLLVGLDMIDLQEYERLYVHPPEGKHKHWMFDVVAKKWSHLKNQQLFNKKEVNYHARKGSE